MTEGKADLISLETLRDICGCGQRQGSGILFVHNHPSGNTEPSEEDFAITERLLDVAKIMGIDVIDHIIVGRNGYFSFQAAGLVKQ